MSDEILAIAARLRRPPFAFRHYDGRLTCGIRSTKIVSIDFTPTAAIGGIHNVRVMRR